VVVRKRSLNYLVINWLMLLWDSKCSLMSHNDRMLYNCRMSDNLMRLLVSKELSLRVVNMGRLVVLADDLGVLLWVHNPVRLHNWLRVHYHLLRVPLSLSDVLERGFNWMSPVINRLQFLLRSFSNMMDIIWILVNIHNSVWFDFSLHDMVRPGPVAKNHGFFHIVGRSFVDAVSVVDFVASRTGHWH
jgi:hypothetical protein